MANVLQMDFAEPAAPGPDPDPYRRIRLASRASAMLFTGLLVAFTLAAAIIILGIVFWNGPGLYIGASSMELTGQHPGPGFYAFHELSPLHRAIYGLTGVIRVAPIVLLLWSVRRLFGLYGKGIVFAKSNTLALKLIGVGLIAHAFVPFLCHLALAAGGWEIDRRWFHADQPQALILGGLVFIIAQVMAAAREIEEDRSQFV